MLGQGSHPERQASFAENAMQPSLFADPPPEAVPSPEGILAEAVALYRPSMLFGLFSGGHDSLCAVHHAARHPLFRAAVHINTGIGVEETRAYVRETCRALGWPLLEYRSPITYESLVLRFGFPGPAGHGMMYTRLKERCLRALVREHKRQRTDRILLVGGMRYSESARRMGTAEPHHREDCRVWCSPIVHWSVDERNAYIDAHRLPKNPVVGKLCMSGECLCGAFAHPNELAELEVCYPRAAAQIHALEAKCRAVGVHAVWGTRPPRTAAPRAETPDLFSLCWSCGQRREENANALA